MSVEEKEDTRAYKVVINHEDQYSIWPEGRQNPAGWRDGGKTGNKKECLAYIQEVWTDMRPRSLREKMDGVATSNNSMERAVSPAGNISSSPKNPGLAWFKGEYGA